MFPSRALWPLLTLPLLAQAPWDILGSRTLVTPFYTGGGVNSTLAPNGDVFLASSPCPNPVKLTATYGTPATCDTVIARVNSAGNFVFAIQLAGIDDAGPSLLLDPAGNLFVAGFTNSPTRFLTTPGAYQPTTTQLTAGFVCKLSAANGTPIFCTFLDVTANLFELDAAGDLLFTQLFASTPSEDLYSIHKLDSSGSTLLLQSVPIDGRITQIVQSPDGTFYLSGLTASPQFPFSTVPAFPPSASYVSYFYGKFDPANGFLFAQDFGLNGLTLVGLQPTGGPVLAGDFGSGYQIRQYAADGLTIVYTRTLPFVLYSVGTPSLVNGGVVLVGAANIANVPLLHNLHVCGQLLDPSADIGSLMIRIDQTGAIVQTTWLGTADFSHLVQASDGSWIAFGAVSNNFGTYGNNYFLQVISVGPNPQAQPQPFGCMADLAQGINSKVVPGLLVALTVESDPGPITFDGAPMPMFAKFNGAIPFSVAGKSTSQMCIAGDCTTVAVTSVAPSVFPTVENQDGSINSATNPAAPGSIVTFYALGLGPLSPTVNDGSIVSPPLPQLTNQVQVEFATGFENMSGPFTPAPPPFVAEVTYAGPAPFEIAGLYQINVRVPTVSITGMVTISIGTASATTKIFH